MRERIINFFNIAVNFINLAYLGKKRELPPAVQKPNVWERIPPKSGVNNNGLFWPTSRNGCYAKLKRNWSKIATATARI